MSTSEVFRPKDGPLVLRGNLSDGPPIPTDSFRRSDRPATQTNRWGNRSINQFFARNVPHASRVKHLKGLLDVPICTVSDPGMFGGPPKTPLQFPPNNFDNKKIKVWSSLPKLPVTSIGINSQLHPSMSLDKRIFREKAIPKVGLVPVTQDWERELMALAQALQLDKPKPPPSAPRMDKTSKYSEETGRLIPPPSRAMSRRSTRGSQRDLRSSQYQHIVAQPDLSGIVLQMLCQVLQTDDVNAVQAWLVSAPDQEKASVMNMIQGALQSNDEYYKHQVEPREWEKIPEEPLVEGTMLPAIEDLPKPDTALPRTIDRLNFEPTVPTNEEDNMDGTHFRYTYSPLQGQRKIPTPMFEEAPPQMSGEITGPVGQDVFKPPPSAAGLKPPMTLEPLPDQPKLRMITPKLTDRNAGTDQPNPDVWSPGKSIAIQ